MRVVMIDEDSGEYFEDGIVCIRLHNTGEVDYVAVSRITGQTYNPSSGAWNRDFRGILFEGETLAQYENQFRLDHGDSRDS